MLQLEEIARKLAELPDDAPEKQVLKAALTRIEQRKLLRYRPYPWQMEFHNAGSHASQRLLMAANGVGKTLCGAAETAYHATGRYPDWWEGKRFDRPPLIWVGSISNQTQRDYTQPALLGENLGDALGSGFIPKEDIVGRPRPRQAGIGDVVDSLRVRHHPSGRDSSIVFKTFEQGWRMWQGAAPNVVWMDEQPDENAKEEKPIFSEVITRIFRSAGIMYSTMTPLLGETEMIRHFMAGGIKGVWWKGATWDDAPHLAEEQKEIAKATYGEHEREARTQGIPMMGEGRVFSSLEADFKVRPRPIPEHWARIVGIDFSFSGGHPAAVSELAWDRDADVLYVVRTWRQSNIDVATHVNAIRGKDPWIPVAWPHDGLNRRDQGIQKGLQTTKQIYMDAGAKMLSKSARYKNDTGGPQPAEPIILEMQNRLDNGGLKVFDTCRDFFEEYRSFHRKDGKIVPVHDDVLKATMYAIMMRRYATTKRLGKAKSPDAYSRAVI